MSGNHREGLIVNRYNKTTKQLLCNQKNDLILYSVFFQIVYILVQTIPSVQNQVPLFFPRVFFVLLLMDE